MFIGDSTFSESTVYCFSGKWHYHWQSSRWNSPHNSYPHASSYSRWNWLCSCRNECSWSAPPIPSTPGECTSHCTRSGTCRSTRSGTQHCWGRSQRSEVHGSSASRVRNSYRCWCTHDGCGCTSRSGRSYGRDSTWGLRQTSYWSGPPGLALCARSLAWLPWNLQCSKHQTGYW